jgi:hypothetical protein
MGGIALGKAVVSSGLLDTMDVGIRHLVSGLQMYEVVLALSAVVMVRSFIWYLMCSYIPDKAMVRQGRVNVHQSHYRKRSSGPYCFRSREKPTVSSPSV